MKVKFVDFEESLMGFASRLIGTMPTTSHKFISGLVLGGVAGRVEKALGVLADSEGYVDTDMLRKAVAGGFRASGERVSFTFGDDSTRLIFRPITVTLTEADLERAISDMESKFGK